MTSHVSLIGGSIREYTGCHNRFRGKKHVFATGTLVSRTRRVALIFDLNWPVKWHATRVTTFGTV